MLARQEEKLYKVRLAGVKDPFSVASPFARIRGVLVFNGRNLYFVEQFP
jgi:hypothetical protein